ncbi:MAG: alpha/beta fold hydrolase [Planctomycetota bacterium]
MQDTRQVTTPDSYSLRYTVWSNPNRKATVVILNGVMGHSGWMSEMGTALCETGLHVVGADRRGSGQNEEGFGDIQSPASLYSDIDLVTSCELASAEPLFVIGWCWGAIPAVLANRHLSAEITGLVLLSPGFFPSSCVMAAAEAGLTANVSMTEAVLPSPVRLEMFSDDPLTLDRLRQDRLKVVQVTKRLLWTAQKMTVAARSACLRLKCPIFLGLASDDRAVDNGRTQTMFSELSVDVDIQFFDGPHGFVLESGLDVAGRVGNWIHSQLFRVDVS